MIILECIIKILSLIALFYVCCWAIVLTKFIFAYAKKYDELLGEDDE